MSAPKKGPLGDVKREAAKAQRADLRKRAVADGMRELMAAPNGRALFAHLVGESGLYHDAHRPSGSDTAYALGRQYLGRHLLGLAKQHAKPDYLRALGEQAREEDTEAALLNREQESDE